jgi:hypothetical protein
MCFFIEDNKVSSKVGKIYMLTMTYGFVFVVILNDLWICSLNSICIISFSHKYYIALSSLVKNNF